MLHTLTSLVLPLALASLAFSPNTPPVVTNVAAAQIVWYVDDDGDPVGGCTSWADACPELQKALSLAEAGDQIWVAVETRLGMESSSDTILRSGRKAHRRVAATTVPPPDHVPGELLVVYEDGVREEEKCGMAASHGMTLLSASPSGLYRYSCEAYSSDPETTPLERYLTLLQEAIRL